MWYDLPQFLDIALTINKMDEYDLSNRLHHKCMPKNRDDTVLVIQFITGKTQSIYVSIRDPYLYSIYTIRLTL